MLLSSWLIIVVCPLCYKREERLMFFEEGVKMRSNLAVVREAKQVAYKAAEEYDGRAIGMIHSLGTVGE